MKSPQIEVYPDSQSLAEAAAKHFIELAQTNITKQGQFNVALSGGSTPRAMHSILAEQYRDEIDWLRVHFFWGDERSVSPDNPDSNFRMAYDTLLEPLSIEPRQIHRIQAELPPEEAASKYQQILNDHLNSKSPHLDLIFLGMGDDGHTASLFPSTTALDETENWVVANWVEKLDTWRITLTAPFINTAQQIIFLVTGKNKAEALKDVLEEPYESACFPSQLIQPHNNHLLWLVDQAAASQLNPQNATNLEK